MRILKLHSDLEKKLKRYQLEKKFIKAKELFEDNSSHPSLKTELLEPKHFKIYSFRLDRKFRAIFVIIRDEAKIIDINLHYQ